MPLRVRQSGASGQPSAALAESPQVD